MMVFQGLAPHQPPPQVNAVVRPRRFAMSNQVDILPEGRLRVMQIVAGILLLGVLVFLSVVLFIVHVRNNGAGIGPPRDLPLLSLLAVLFFAVQAPLAFVVPGLQTRSSLRQIASGNWRLPPGASETAFSTDASKLLAVRQTTMIVGLALLEGAAFLACIAYLQEAQLYVLGVVLAAVVLMLVIFPTEGRIRSWLERQADQLVELRELGRISAER
jgi:hypothetical protein